METRILNSTNTMKNINLSCHLICHLAVTPQPAKIHNKFKETLIMATPRNESRLRPSLNKKIALAPNLGDTEKERLHQRGINAKYKIDGTRL